MPQIVNLDAVDNGAETDSGGLTKGVTLSGFNPGDTLSFSLPSGQTYTAWSGWSDLRAWINRVQVIRDGTAGNSELFKVQEGAEYQNWYATAEEARAAFNTVSHTITGASSYTFYLPDSPVSDNSGGLSVQVDVTPAAAPQGRALTTNAVFFRLDTDPPLRLWCGINDIPIGIDVIDEAGSVYLGAGRLLNVPDLEVLINGAADRVEFFLPGASVENANRVATAAVAMEIQGAPVHVGRATLDDRYQPVTPIEPVWYGLADLWAMRQPMSADPAAPPSRTLVLSAGSGRTGRSRARRAAYTSAQQKLRFPTDKFCDFVSRYTSLYEVTWPKF